MTWYEPLRGIRSKGSQAERPGSLAALASAREHHQGQFFTPDLVAKLMWRISQPAMEERLTKSHRVTVLDNSVGSGRLLQMADPAIHELYGVDVDRTAVGELGQVAEAAGFKCHFEAAGMERVDVKGMDVALINPPFSLHLEAPTMEAYPCCSFGKYGPGTSALSHAYALAQALDAAETVVALLPSTFAEDVMANPVVWLGEDAPKRLRGLVELPASTFREEGTEVRTSLLVFGCAWSGRGARPFTRVKVVDLERETPTFFLRALPHREPSLRVRQVDNEGPAITLPVTGDKIVRVVHDGRRIDLRFLCGLTQAKVLNAIHCHRIREMAPPDHRHPKGFRYTGQGVLDMEVHLAQTDPEASFAAFLEDIRAAGGAPVVDPGLRGYLKRRIRASARQATPLRHTVWVPEGQAAVHADTVVGTSRRTMVANPKVWGSPLIKAGQEVSFTRNGSGGYDFSYGEALYTLSAEDLHRSFEVTEGAAASGWVTAHAGLRAAYPELAHGWDKRARAMGIDGWLNWDYQLADAIELSMKPRGAIAAWNMGLGKARLAVALILLSGCRHGLIVTESGLIDEMEIELRGLPVNPKDWQVITRPEHVQSLRRINVIAYERLRRTARGRKTYGKLLRRRIGVLCADEGDVLSNPKTDQSRALIAISAKKRYLLSGTLSPNYPRDVLPMLTHICGDGTAAQPWGWHRGKLEENWRQSVSHAERGVAAFQDAFVELEWVTNEWKEDMLTGAKREVPRISNVEAYRAMLAGHVKRRIDEEPEVSAHIHIPKATREVVEVPWDEAHLAYYLEVAEEFRQWYSQIRRDEGKKSNLIAILARIRAVGLAADYPQHGVDGFGHHMPLTSKQRWVLSELEALAGSERKTILYTESPGQVEMLSRLLGNRGIEAVKFHGEIPIKQRVSDLKRFRFGETPILLATLGVTQKGLNIHQASEVILMSRSWSSTTEEQAIHRVLRPQQKRNVRVRYVHLPGGIDEYKAQLVHWKGSAARAGLDWATPETDGESFVHLDTILSRFCNDLAKLMRVDRWDLRHVLRERKEVSNVG